MRYRDCQKKLVSTPLGCIPARPEIIKQVCKFGTKESYHIISLKLGLPFHWNVFFHGIHPMEEDL